jgi:hypothetical protein
MSRTTARAGSDYAAAASAPRTERAAAARGAGGALARVEGRKLVLHPVFLAGLGMGLLGIALFVPAALSSPGSSLQGPRDGWTVAVGFVLVGLLTLVAANHAALRDVREHTEEQHGSLPVGEPVRTAAGLGSVAWPAVAVVTLLGAVVAFGYATAGFAVEDAVHLLGLVGVVAMLGTLGIALARWLPNPFVAPIVAFALLMGSNSEAGSFMRVLSPVTFLEGTRSALWHLAYVGGLTMVWCAAALLRRVRRPAFVGVGAVGLAVSGVSFAVTLSQQV